MWCGAVVQPQAFEFECHHLGKILQELDGNGLWKPVGRGEHFLLDLSQASWQDSQKWNEVWFVNFQQQD